MPFYEEAGILMIIRLLRDSKVDLVCIARRSPERVHCNYTEKNFKLLLRESETQNTEKTDECVRDISLVFLFRITIPVYSR